MISILKRYTQLQFNCQQYIALASHIKQLMEMSVTVVVLLEVLLLLIRNNGNFGYSLLR